MNVGKLVKLLLKKGHPKKVSTKPSRIRNIDDDIYPKKVQPVEEYQPEMTFRDENKAKEYYNKTEGAEDYYYDSMDDLWVVKLKDPYTKKPKSVDDNDFSQ